MSNTFKLTVTLPDGTTASRRTAHEYTHVLAVKGGKDNVWSAYSWHHGRTNADKALGRFLRDMPRWTYKVAPGEINYTEPGSPRLLEVDPR